MPKEQQNTMTRFHMTKEDLIGKNNEPSENYDLMEVVMICRGEDKFTDGILDYLAGLFSHNIDRMDRYSHIKNDAEVTEEVRIMGGFGKALAEKNLMQGREEGKIEERKNILDSIVKNLMKSNASMTREQATEQAKALIA